MSSRSGIRGLVQPWDCHGVITKATPYSAHMLAAALSSLAFSSRQAPRLHQSRAGPVAASVDRRAVLGAAAAALAAVPAASFADKPAASDGKWAQHDQDEPFTDEDFKGFTTSPTGLEYKVVQEGFG